MDDAAVVAGLMNGGPGLGLDDEDVELAVSAGKAASGGETDDPGPDADDVGALWHGGVQSSAAPSTSGGTPGISARG